MEHPARPASPVNSTPSLPKCQWRLTATQSWSSAFRCQRCPTIPSPLASPLPLAGACLHPLPPETTLRLQVFDKDGRTSVRGPPMSTTGQLSPVTGQLGPGDCHQRPPHQSHVSTNSVQGLTTRLAVACRLPLQPFVRISDAPISNARGHAFRPFTCRHARRWHHEQKGVQRLCVVQTRPT